MVMPVQNLSRRRDCGRAEPACCCMRLRQICRPICHYAFQSSIGFGLYYPAGRNIARVGAGRMENYHPEPCLRAGPGIPGCPEFAEYARGSRRRALLLRFRYNSDPIPATYVSPLQGSFLTCPPPRAYARGYSLPPLRGWGSCFCHYNMRGSIILGQIHRFRRRFASDPPIGRLR